MYRFRPAHPTEAAEACVVIRRSIEELCIVDHDRDPAILEPWLANKTPERVGSWIESDPAGTIVAVSADDIAGVGCILPDGVIGLLYVAPSAVGQGVGRGLLRRMEQIALAAGVSACTQRSTGTARGFYLACGYEEVGEPVVSYGGKPAYPMRRTIA